MMILSCEIGETVQIKEGISVRLLDVKGNQVRLGIEAPRNIPIYQKNIAHPQQTNKTNERI